MIHRIETVSAVLTPHPPLHPVERGGVQARSEAKPGALASIPWALLVKSIFLP